MKFKLFGYPTLEITTLNLLAIQTICNITLGIKFEISMHVKLFGNLTLEITTLKLVCNSFILGYPTHEIILTMQLKAG